MGEFSGKVVVVTGGSRGIGKAIAASFAREGAQTVLAASSQANLDKAAQEIGNSGPKPLTFAGDLKKLENCEALHAFVKEKAGRCDVLVNNAGATRSRQFPRDAGRGVPRRLRAEIFRLHAALETVLADAEGARGQRRQHHRRRGAHARRAVPGRRLGECRDGEFLQGAERPGQEGRRERQRDPSGHDRDGSHRHAVRAAREGERHHAGRDPQADDGEGRPAPHRPAGGCGRACGVPRVRQARGTSRAPRSRSTAGRRPDCSSRCRRASPSSARA